MSNEAIQKKSVMFTAVDPTDKTQMRRCKANQEEDSNGSDRRQDRQQASSKETCSRSWPRDKIQISHEDGNELIAVAPRRQRPGQQQQPPQQQLKAPITAPVSHFPHHPLPLPLPLLLPLRPQPPPPRLHQHQHKTLVSRARQKLQGRHRAAVCPAVQAERRRRQRAARSQGVQRVQLQAARRVLVQAPQARREARDGLAVATETLPRARQEWATQGQLWPQLQATRARREMEDSVGRCEHSAAAAAPPWREHSEQRGRRRVSQARRSFKE